jgi:DNA-binding beta-propeller fold protein YncE
MHPKPMRVVFVLFALLAQLASTGCSMAPVEPQAQVAEAPAWPRPPETARIRYLRGVAAPADWGITQGFFGRLVDVITGQNPLRLIRPTGVVERGGILYVADPGARSLFIFDPGQSRARQVRRVGDEVLLSPVALALGPEGSLFLVDSALKKVYALDREGALLRVIAQEGLERPAAVAYDAASGHLYVADSHAHRIGVYASDGRPIRSFGGHGGGAGEFNAPTHLALTRDHSLLVTDALNFRIQAFDDSGRFLWTIGKVGDGAGDFSAPKGVAADSAGHVYVVDALFDAIQIFRGDGELLLGFGERGTRAGQFWLPGGLFMSPQDVLYVADAYNQRIQLFQVLPDAQKEGGK